MFCRNSFSDFFPFYCDTRDTIVLIRFLREFVYFFQPKIIKTSYAPFHTYARARLQRWTSVHIFNDETSCARVWNWKKNSNKSLKKKTAHAARFVTRTFQTECCRLLKKKIKTERNVFLHALYGYGLGACTRDEEGHCTCIVKKNKLSNICPPAFENVKKKRIFEYSYTGCLQRNVRVWNFSLWIFDVTGLPQIRLCVVKLTVCFRCAHKNEYTAIALIDRTIAIA